MTNTITNADRAKSAGSALRHFQHVTGVDKADALCDLLCNLMHWATANSFDFDTVLWHATGHYKAELAEAEELPDTISIAWSILDVEEIRPDLTKDQCRQVLAAVRDRHDATIGVNWDTLSIIADDLYPEP